MYDIIDMMHIVTIIPVSLLVVVSSSHIIFREYLNFTQECNVPLAKQCTLTHLYSHVWQSHMVLICYICQGAIQSLTPVTANKSCSLIHGYLLCFDKLVT